MSTRQVPGMWKCPKCSCLLVQRIFRADTGELGVSLTPKPAPPCPNNCGPCDPLLEPLH